MNVTDDEVIHEVSRWHAYRNFFDGITRCHRVFLRRDDPGSKLGVWTAATTAALNPGEIDWVLVSRTEKQVTCMACIGDDA